MIRLTNVNHQATYLRASDIVAVHPPDPAWKKFSQNCNAVAYLRHPVDDISGWPVVESVERVIELIEILAAMKEEA